MKELPKYFVIKRDEKNPLWKEYIDWLNRTYWCSWTGDDYNYYGYDGNSYCTDISLFDNPKAFKNSPTLITLEEWSECVNWFVLPEKWMVTVTEENKTVLREWVKIKVEVGEYVTYKKLWGNSRQYEYTEITYEQFKTHVLKENNMEEEAKDMPFEKWKVGDLIECVNTHFDCYIKGEIYEIKRIEYSMNNDIYTVKDSVGSNTNAWNHSNFKFHSRQSKPMKNRTITAQQAQSIIDIAQPQCSWKPRLAKLWGETIALKRRIDITEDFYKEMRSACTEPQHKLFDEIFGKDVKEFTSDDLEVGEYMENSIGNHFLKTRNLIVCIETGKSYQGNFSFTGKKVKIKSIQWEVVK